MYHKLFKRNHLIMCDTFCINAIKISTFSFIFYSVHVLLHFVNCVVVPYYRTSKELALNHLHTQVNTFNFSYFFFKNVLFRVHIWNQGGKWIQMSTNIFNLIEEVHQVCYKVKGVILARPKEKLTFFADSFVG